MRVVELWRHPVKSLQGERLDHTVIEADGVAGDRCWGIYDRTTGLVLTGRREPRLLLASACLSDDGNEPAIVLDDGTELHGLGSEVDAALSDWLGRDVVLAAAAGRDAGVGEFFSDPVDEDSEPVQWTMPEGRFVDAAPLLILTTASLRAGKALHPDGVWDTRRFRPNIVVEADGDGWIEDDWCGRVVRVGSVEIDVRYPTGRCTMVTRPQPGLGRDLDVFRVLAREHGATFGVWCFVNVPGSVNVGDDVEVAAA